MTVSNRALTTLVDALRHQGVPRLRTAAAPEKAAAERSCPPQTQRLRATDPVGFQKSA